ncbi:hypothetical protein T492DRAFT_1103328 [Pavlovales sp. CCMP2436]|nr:hypothetical protein T492DRAFT_1103328 [Pavlovales sp. CCMP2436]
MASWRCLRRPRCGCCCEARRCCSCRCPRAVMALAEPGIALPRCPAGCPLTSLGQHPRMRLAARREGAALPD